MSFKTLLLPELIESREKSRSDELSRINSAERKGIQQGKLEGRLERQIELVKNMYKEGASINFIIKVSNLSESEINKII